MKYKSLPEMKAKLQDIRSQLLGGIEKTIKSSKDEEFTQVIPDTTDEASRSFSRQILLNLGEQDREKLIQVEEALYQIENGGYGTCKLCEEPIPEPRLKVVPFAQHCVSCLSIIEQNQKNNGHSGSDHLEAF
ncbi:MAG: TraR/DksA C4-type zinc finger protein [Nitrospinota bacterium]|nr:TraR/DksA C4-type zinc finger protein [Nitrospinota bacterium]MDH5789770.1 TraR/DksA C4-type zinc finger protein [Nitrospinota bacterium]